MSPSDFTYDRPATGRPQGVREVDLETAFIDKLGGLMYTIRSDIHDRAALEANFREKFEALNRVKLTDGEYERLLDEIVTPDVFTAARTLREINGFTGMTARRSTTPWSTSRTGARTPSRWLPSSGSIRTTVTTVTTCCS